MTQFSLHSHQPVERYPGGSGGKVEHGELCLPVTSVFYHNLFFFSLFLSVASFFCLVE